jgi:hypothetical protein
MPDEVTGEVTALTERRPWLGLPSTEVRTGEFWETLSYRVMWLCGWICIGLCFG